MTSSYDCSTEETRFEGLAHAQRAIAEQQCIVFPTDTVYGIAADAFSPLAVRLLLAAKGRSRTMPPPVLIPRVQTMDGLAVDIGDDARKLAEKFWPGALTLILHAQPSLEWDLGETKGTVALRVPDDELALEILARTGPLAVSSANRSGQPAAQTAANAQEQLAESVEVYLDGGPRPAESESEDIALPSTIVDCTGSRARVVRQGAIALEDLRDVVPSILAFGQEVPVWQPGADSALNGEDAATDADVADDAEPAEPAEQTDAPETPDAATDAADAAAEDNSSEDTPSAEDASTAEAATPDAPADLPTDDTAQSAGAERIPGQQEPGKDA
ncbi:L-threonylcarbamoyladenylate synthase [Arthrobacter woluwensis]|uniref:L-threonylcarbamoyladenylate synthase n=1 Tax=Arthrobacter woluwensis TaxID=156980 RepID=UPI00277DD4D9|nr:L-threonylcarbamoyladenylate synthase [Arthrobacter woluwensis]MDQ0709298.1 L-threonylcarbamoyladenylate synthase [Arthrobacter woluwensis]